MKRASIHYWLTICLLLLTGSAGCYRPSVTAGDPAVLDRLLHAMRQRLLLMHDVARWKWNEQQPLTDAARETAFLDRTQARGRTQGLDETLVRTFFQAQIEAAKQVQASDFERWQAEGRGKFANVPDLASEQRPRIDAASDDLLDALADAQPSLTSGAFRRQLAARAAGILAGEGITDRVRETALTPLLSP
ncbi:MAG: gamma subclass chorismate mutase AroQ [Planctomycetia bacterium]|nr:gamma subclass chorismate mutase AroQ [Planctomycetia bacterium]